MILLKHEFNVVKLYLEIEIFCPSENTIRLHHQLQQVKILSGNKRSENR